MKKADLEKKIQNLEKERQIYKEFWETDAIESIWKRDKRIAIILFVLSAIFLSLSMLLLVLIERC